MLKAVFMPDLNINPKQTQYMQTINQTETYNVVCNQLTGISYDDCDKTCTLSIFIIKSEVWPFAIV